MNIFLEIIKNPAIVIAIVTLIGLVAIKSKPTKIISGTIISFVGFSMIKLGSGILAVALTAFSRLFSEAFHLQGVVPSNEAMFALILGRVGGSASIMLVVALVVNILVARFTRFKTIYLSLQLTLYISFALSTVFLLGKVQTVIGIIFGGILIGLYMAISPTLMRRYTRDVIGNDDYTIAHTGSFAMYIGTFLAGKFGNKEHDAENIEMNDSILFLKDPIVATTLMMLILFLIDTLLAHGPVAKEILAGQDFITFSLTQAASFAAGLFIFKAGVKMFIDEIVPAFKGFAKIFAPGSIPAVDVLVLFDKAPNTALIGFLTSFVMGAILIVVLPLLHLPVIIPGLLAFFTIGGAAAIMGNAQGGIRGAIISSVTSGVILSVLPAIAIGLFSGIGAKGTTFADPDTIILSAIVWVVFRFI